jgi:hypothetical protein
MKPWIDLTVDSFNVSFENDSAFISWQPGNALLKYHGYIVYEYSNSDNFETTVSPVIVPRTDINPLKQVIMYACYDTICGAVYEINIKNPQ